MNDLEMIADALLKWLPPVALNVTVPDTLPVRARSVGGSG